METVSGKVVLCASLASACGRVPLVATVSHSGTDDGSATAHCDAQECCSVDQSGANDTDVGTSGLATSGEVQIPERHTVADPGLLPPRSRRSVDVALASTALFRASFVRPSRMTTLPVVSPSATMLLMWRGVRQPAVLKKGAIDAVLSGDTVLGMLGCSQVHLGLCRLAPPPPSAVDSPPLLWATTDWSKQAALGPQVPAIPHPGSCA